ncbi:MAG: CBS domain-containing protein [Desulfobacteraceae bacterium]
MKDKKVKDLMVSLSDYATVHEDETLFEALMALEKAHEKLDPSTHRHRAILILDKNDRVVGKLSQWDILKSLEPKYGNIEDLEKISRTGFSPQFLKSMLVQHALWNKPLMDVCRVGGKNKVRDVMYKPTEGEYINVSAPLGEAINQLVVGQLLSLLVVDDEKNIIGILKLIDVFDEVLQTMKSCEI